MNSRQNDSLTRRVCRIVKMPFQLSNLVKRSEFENQNLTNWLIFQVTLDTYEDLVVEMKMKYYDTVPPANSMCILKTGFLFVAAEFGDQSVFKNV